MKFWVNLLIVNLFGVVFTTKYPRDADQMSWAIKTCVYELNQKLEDKVQDFCFHKCFWQYSGFYDENRKEIKVNEVRQQFIDRAVEIPKNIDSLKEATGDDCSVIREMSLKVILDDTELFIKAFYGNAEDIVKWYQDNAGNVKAYGQLASEFCNKKFQEDCKVNCQYYYYRIIDEDYKFLNYRKLEVPGISEDQVSDCRKRTENFSTCSIAQNFKACLENVNKAAWNEVEEYLDKVSAMYDY
ncbi:hypothetical protein DMENIID0001_148290 [Sergentomyia squamirostris]